MASWNRAVPSVPGEQAATGAHRNPDCIVIHMLPSTHNMDHTSGQKLLSVIEDPALREFLKGGMEVTDEVFEQNAEYIFQEAGNRKHTIKAVIKAVLGER